MRRISSWGRLNALTHNVIGLSDSPTIKDIISRGPHPGLAHGMGRSYGDVCLNPLGTLWLTTALDRLIAFDDRTGLLVCEAGVLLGDIQRLMIPRGWSLPVVPGTQMVTVGGAIANDVHGKNHHGMGSFGDHVTQLTLLRTDGETIVCGPNLQSNWFAATVGGIGLTGVIAQATIQLHPVPGPWLETETIPFADFDAFFQIAAASEAGWEHTVSWIDSVSRYRGRGLFLRGNSAVVAHPPEVKKINLKMPFTLPISLFNRQTIRLFNMAYYTLHALKAGRNISHYTSYFYPLDNVLEWNRIYGKRGFFQYQSVVPNDVGKFAVQAMMKEIAASGDGSFLTTLKTFGDRQPIGMLSFPQPGVTLALDVPNRGQRSLMLFDRLDAIVREAKGRLYLAKDARMPRDLFEAGYPRLAEFIKYRDPGISSSLSRRLMGH